MLEVERAYYEEHRAELVRQYDGKHVLIKGMTLTGPYESFEEALQDGYARYGATPMFVQQVAAVDPIIFNTWSVRGWPVSV